MYTEITEYVRRNPTCDEVRMAANFVQDNLGNNSDRDRLAVEVYADYLRALMDKHDKGAKL
jgi:hypothetical protein